MIDPVFLAIDTIPVYLPSLMEGFFLAISGKHLSKQKDINQMQAVSMWTDTGQKPVFSSSVDTMGSLFTARIPDMCESQTQSLHDGFFPLSDYQYPI
ncbi:hypothetical protein AU509_14575 [Lonsdalea britannica]|uniref:hypothetical protein n=1 Tax=Lonsdalea britannica TaxID=1082704 RepID=UPI000A2159F9|nr:hypothetical protein [Lonsdalea britannica]OSM94966.1 hypothetical protein AU509_14575 [Lonsdalea britannica]